MRSRPAFTKFLLAAAAAATLSACRNPETGPITVSAIGGSPEVVNPNLRPLDPPSAFLLETTAQGLVRFDSSGEIEPALAQSWIVSDDGRRYTFRIRRTAWIGDGRVTAEQVAGRLRAAVSRASSNRLKPALGAIENVVAMTDQVLEISLQGPRPNFLQLLAQPEMAILRSGSGTGPYRHEGANPVRLSPVHDQDEEEAEEEPREPHFLFWGEPASLAIARFAAGEAELVTGGGVGGLPLVRAAGLVDNRLRFDPVSGLFGLVFVAADGRLADPAVRRAMSMAVDRNALTAALGVPGLQPRTTLVPSGLDELPQPVGPDWAGLPLAARRELAARTIAEAGEAEPLRARVALPDGPGYRLLFAYLRRDWRLIGVEAERVTLDAPADLRLVDAVAPALMASWYLQHFSCAGSAVCDAAADEALAAARRAPPAERQVQLAAADRALAELTPFIPLASPVRWSLVAPRLTGFRPNPFGRHPAATLIAPVS